MFKFNGVSWINTLNFTSHTADVNVVIFLSTGQVASGSSDNSVKIWSYQNGSVSISSSVMSANVYALAQISTNIMAVGGDDVKVWIWNYSNNTVLRTIQTIDWERTITAITSNIIAVGTTNAANTYLIDWTTGEYSRYKTNGGNIIGTAVTSSMLIVSVGENTQWIKVRDISQLNISVGNDVCNKTFTYNLRSIVALSPLTISKLLLDRSNEQDVTF